jgi:hypothetical protein
MNRYIDIAPKFILYLILGGDDPWKDIPIDEESRKYLHIRV